jgi:hypothetical protein
MEADSKAPKTLAKVQATKRPALAALAWTSASASKRAYALADARSALWS